MAETGLRRSSRKRRAPVCDEELEETKKKELDEDMIDEVDSEWTCAGALSHPVGLAVTCSDGCQCAGCELWFCFGCASTTVQRNPPTSSVISSSSTSSSCSSSSSLSETPNLEEDSPLSEATLCWSVAQLKGQDHRVVFTCASCMAVVAPEVTKSEGKAAKPPSRAQKDADRVLSIPEAELIKNVTQVLSGPRQGEWSPRVLVQTRRCSQFRKHSQLRTAGTWAC